MTGDADAASAATGIPAKFMLGQAALETGWGKRVMQNPDGSSSHNLFGIKAGAGWTGKTVTAVTTEYVNGVPTTRSEKFRAYDTYADSFKDYANLLKSNPRYDKVLANATDASGFAQGLQRAGYATDPVRGEIDAHHHAFARMRTPHYCRLANQDSPRRAVDWIKTRR